MRSLAYHVWIVVLLLPAATLSHLAQATSKKTYIVHMNHHAKPESHPTNHDWYTATVQSLTSSSDSLLYTYDTAFHGFAAYLHPDQVSALRMSENVLHVYESKLYRSVTTRTSQFLGLDDAPFGGLFEHGDENFIDIGKASYDMIIGVVDHGVWPESQSFHDHGMPPIPSRWKGTCVSAPNFSPKLCNKKLIGARYFSKDYHAQAPKPWDVDSPRDNDGHGTHCASTAAGSRVENASFFGFAKGTARGTAVNARVASYKACWSFGCAGGDIIAAMEAAIKDGVDVISLSIVYPLHTPYEEDPIAVAGFSAMEKNIFLSAGAGNDGPSAPSLHNLAPWFLTVAAGTLDRDFPAQILLGNNKTLAGISLYKGDAMGKQLRAGKLVYFEDNNASRLCIPGSITKEMASGKVVICDGGQFAEAYRGLAVNQAGGLGAIVVNPDAVMDVDSEPHLFPTVEVGKKVGALIKRYAKSETNPTAVLRFGGTVLNVKPAPVVAYFSSRGPNDITPQILKPDILAPGVNILAAWADTASPSIEEDPRRNIKYNIISGTSMATPHVSGIAALLKAAHPTWSISAIKSALMTTAYTRDNTNSPLLDSTTGKHSNPWAHGSGHVDPPKALKPGLVYDISAEDYVTFLCSLNYNISTVRAITSRPNMTCVKKFADPGELNYPSFSVVFGKKKIVTYSREVTNVGEAKSIYNVVATSPSSVATVTVKPARLIFKSAGERKRYTVTFESKRDASLGAKPKFGSIVWSNKQHVVSSPVAFTWT